MTGKKTESEGLGSKIAKLGAKIDRVIAALEKNDPEPAVYAYAIAEDLGPSVFSTIMDTLDLDPHYKPHRNADAVRIAKLMSKLIKMNLCKRAMNEDGRLCWRFLDDKAYDTAIETLTGEQGALCKDCMFTLEK